jgi:serine phosphatase RsbU (regulator of sigma subunit)
MATGTIGLERLVGRPWQVALLVAVLVGIPVLAVGELTANGTRQRVREQQLAETRAVAVRAADAVAGRTDSMVAQLSLAVSIGDLRSALEEGDVGRVQDIVVTFHRRTTADIVRLIALDRSFNVVALDPLYSDLVGKRSGRYDDVVTLRRANLRGETAVYSDLYASDTVGNPPTVSIAVAVLSPRGREGPFSGALVAELDPHRLAAWVAPLLASADEIYVVDRAGRLIVRASASAADTGRDLAADPVVSAALAHQDVTRETTDPFGRGERFASTIELDQVGWHVVVERSTAALERDLDAVLGQLFVQRVVLILVLLVATYLIAAALGEVRRLARRDEEHMRRALDRVNEQLRIARDIQTALLPKTVQPAPGWDVATYYQPAADVGGDFYDVIYLPDGKQGLVIGDVTGHGVGAALLMAATLGTLRTEAPLAASPGDVLRRVNDKLCVEIPPGNFVTCLYGMLDPASGRFRFANAGHPVPYVRSQGSVIEAKARGMPLGLIPGSVYEESEIDLAVDDHCVFYTDGVTEAHRDGVMFGGPRLKDIVRERVCGRAFIDLLLKRLRDMTGPEWEQEDDITLMTVERQR